jgi:hypothetical protein
MGIPNLRTLKILSIGILTAETARRFDVFILSQAGIPSIEEWLTALPRCVYRRFLF